MHARHADLRVTDVTKKWEVNAEIPLFAILAVAMVVPYVVVHLYDPASLPWENLFLPLTARHALVIISRASGEEVVYRALPVVLMLACFPRNVVLACGAGIVAQIGFGFLHPWTTPLQLALVAEGILFLTAYLLFGGLQNREFTGLVAAATLHSIHNIGILVVARYII